MPEFPDVRSYISFKANIIYSIQDADESSDPRYYGYADITGACIIMEQTQSTGAHRYFVDKETYTTHWTNRASLTYDYIFNVI
jgi:hypothetical protein